MNLLSRWYLHRDLRRNLDLAIGREFAREAGGFHVFLHLPTSSHVGPMLAAVTS